MIRLNKEILGRIAIHKKMAQLNFRDGHDALDMGSRVADNHRKLRRLSQTMGKIADALEAVECHPKGLNAQNELSYHIESLAANCIAWLESFEA